MNPVYSAKTITKLLVMTFTLSVCKLSFAHEVKDLKYGAILFEFYQNKYFEALVEYEYANENGGINNHGSYPELLKGGISLSYGLSTQAENIFERLIADNLPEPVRNRAWFYMAKMLYMKGDHASADRALANIQGKIDYDVNHEYQYLNILNDLKIDNASHAIKVANSANNDGKYGPYILFNKGIALARTGNYANSIEVLSQAATLANRSKKSKNLADRAKMAIAYIAAQQSDFITANQYLNTVKTEGVYSNQALLSHGWLAVNQKKYQQALPSLTALEKRSVAIPEVQEAMLLVPHIYERMALPGRAANGFINAYSRYEYALELIKRARTSLEEKDMLELFVLNLDQVMEESDWFGTAPRVALNSLSPFMLDLMSDHSFQSVLKDLRDLYAIRNNINQWRAKEHEFDIILQARSRATKAGLSMEKANQDLNKALTLQTKLEKQVKNLSKKDKKRMSWLLDETKESIKIAEAALEHIKTGGGKSFYDQSFAPRIKQVKQRLAKEEVRTQALIDKIEAVLTNLVLAELDLHEQRIGYYMVQAQLAKTRILDRNLIELDPTADLTEQNTKENDNAS